VAVAKYALEHFYYGQFVRNNQAEGDARLLARSAGIKDEQVEEALQAAALPAMPYNPSGAWALIRGSKVPFFMAQAQTGEAGQSMLHIIIMPTDVLRGLSGNLTAMQTLVEPAMPVYDRLGDTLPPRLLPQAGAPSDEQQIDAILSLMTYTGNQTNTIMKLLSALVQGQQIVIQNAPADLSTRVTFIEGLLALLPASTRFGVTFTTHLTPKVKLNTQISFYSGESYPENALFYDWELQQVSGDVHDDEYSRFIISQLRLDAELVLQQTQRLTPIAGWRIKRGDNLTEALGYASNRLSVDDAVLNNQPVEIDDVSRILMDDPTLSEDLRLVYARHIVAMALALEEAEPADPIALMLRRQPELEDEIMSQMRDAMAEGKAPFIYNMLAHWLSNPLGPVNPGWGELLNDAALEYAQDLTKQGDIKLIVECMNSILHAPVGLDLSRVVPRIIELGLRFSAQDKGLAQIIFVLATLHLNTDTLRRLLATPQYTSQLPGRLNKLLPYLNGTETQAVPDGLLVDVASTFGDEWRDLILIRLAEIAMLTGHLEVFDPAVLAGLLRASLSAWRIHYKPTLLWLARNLSNDNMLLALEQPGPRIILQIFLACGAYQELAAEMHHHARLLFPGDLQSDYVVMIQHAFIETPIPLEEAPVALRAINEAGINKLPYAMACIGVLEGQQWSPELEELAAEVTEIIVTDDMILRVIQIAPMLALLNYHRERHDLKNALRIAGRLSAVAINDPKNGLPGLVRVYKMLDWDKQAKNAGLDVLREYIRHIEPRAAQHAIKVFARELSPGVGHILRTTSMLWRMLDNLELDEYADFLHITTEFLYDTARAYATKDKKKTPDVHDLMTDLDSMTGGLSDDDRRMIDRDLLGIARAILALGSQYSASRPRRVEEHVHKLVKGEADPTNGVEVLLACGGYLSRGKRYTLTLTIETEPHPFGDRNAPMMREETQIAHQVLRSIISAFPTTRETKIKASVLRDEMDSLWRNLSLHQQRQVVHTLALDFQRLADLIVVIADAADEKAMQPDSSLGQKLDENKYRPRSTIELYRFSSGYFRMRTR